MCAFYSSGEKCAKESALDPSSGRGERGEWSIMEVGSSLGVQC